MLGIVQDNFLDYREWFIKNKKDNKKHTYIKLPCGYYVVINYQNFKT